MQERITITPGCTTGCVILLNLPRTGTKSETLTQVSQHDMPPLDKTTHTRAYVTIQINKAEDDKY